MGLKSFKDAKENETVRFAELTGYLCVRADLQKLNYTQTAKKLGISRDMLSDAIHGRTNYTMLTFLKILDALDLEVTVKPKRTL